MHTGTLHRMKAIPCGCHTSLGLSHKLSTKLMSKVPFQGEIVHRETKEDG